MATLALTENPMLEVVWEALRENWAHQAPVTYAIIGFVVGIYAVEVVFTLTRGLAGTRVFATGLFGVAPYVAWPLSPFLHRGILHFGSSLVGLWLLGVPIEQHWGRWRYAAFLLASGYVATAVGVATMVPFTAKNVAFYGSSGMIFALGGFAVVFFPRWFGEVQKNEWLATLVGTVAVVTVVVDPLTGPYLTAEWINGGHLGGLTIGVVVGLWRRNTSGSSGG